MTGPGAPRRPTRRNLIDRARFAIERLVLRGLRYRLLLAAAIVAAVALVAGALVATLDGGAEDLSEHVWWAFLRLTDPGYLGDDEGVVRRSVSTIVTVLGYLLFLGLLIAILTQWLNQVIAKLESGVTPVAISDHVIVLGWSHRTPTLVAELLGTGARLDRFLASHSARELRIVIMAEHVDGELLRELRERLGELWCERQILLRSGNPLRVDHLERVAFRDAAVMILPGADFGERRPETVDAQTVKTLMAVSRHAREAGAAPPRAVAELYDGRRAFVARGAYEGESEILATDDIISRLIAESVRQRGVCGVFTELLTLGVGNAVYVRAVGRLAGTRFGNIRGAFSRAIVLGTLRSGEGWPALNPDPQTVLSEEDLLVFVARAFEDCVPGEEFRAGSQIPQTPTPRAAPGTRRVLILGWSRKVPALLEAFAYYGDDAFEIDVVSSTPGADRVAAMARHASDRRSSRVRQIEAGFTAPGVLERLEPGSYDNIVLLASERLDDEEQADATTVFAYLMLCKLLSKEDPRPGLLVELLDEENRFLFEGEHEDVMVSPLLVSYLLSQVALRRELAAVFAELSRPQGPQIVLEPAETYLDSGKPVRFEDLERAADARGEIALGLRRARPSDVGLALNPDRETEWRLGPGDELVVLRSYAESEGAV
jgi:hypothetical protein